MKIYEIVIDNFSNGTMLGSPLPRGCLNITVDQIPKFIYRQAGNTFYAEADGLVQCFQYNKYDNKGFAGRAITLDVLGRGKVFKERGTTKVTFNGTLWDTYNATLVAACELNTNLYQIGVRDQRAGYFCSFYCTQELMNKLAQHVIFGKAISKEESLGL